MYAYNHVFDQTNAFILLLSRSLVATYTHLDRPHNCNKTKIKVK